MVVMMNLEYYLLKQSIKLGGVFWCGNHCFFTLFDTHDMSFPQRHHSGLSSSSYWIHSPTQQLFMHTMQLRTFSHQTIPTTTKFHLSISIKSRIGVHRCMRLWTWCAQLLRQQTRFWHSQDRGIWVATHRLSHILGGFGEEWRWRCESTQIFTHFNLPKTNKIAVACSCFFWVFHGILVFFVVKLHRKIHKSQRIFCGTWESLTKSPMWNDTEFLNLELTYVSCLYSL